MVVGQSGAEFETRRGIQAMCETRTDARSRETLRVSVTKQLQRWSHDGL